MRHSSFWMTSARLALAGVAGSLLLACGEAPGDPVGPGELPASFHHKEGHETGKVEATITIVTQPNVVWHDETRCRVQSQVRFDDAKGEVFVEVYWIGGTADALHAGTLRQRMGPLHAKDFNGLILAPGFLHPNDGHEFDLIRFILRNDKDKELARADSDGGGVLSCDPPE